MSKAETVYLSTKAKSDKRYHAREDCPNFPKSVRETTHDVLKDHYDGCAMCVEDASADPLSGKKTEYECVQCGTTALITSKAVRTLHACQDCGDMTTFERFDQ